MISRFNLSFLILVVILRAGVDASGMSVQSDSIRFFCGMETNDNAPCWINLSTRTQVGGKSFSRTDDQHPYGIGWASSLPGADGHQSYRARVSFRIRCFLPASGVKLVFAIEKNGKKVSWESVDVSDKLVLNDEWNQVRNLSQVIPASYTSFDYTFSCYVWNSAGLSPLDIDDFEIVFSPIQPRSFLPSVPSLTTMVKGVFADLYWGPEFSIQYDKLNGACRILNREGKIVFDDLRIYTQQRTEAVKSAMPKWDGFLTYVGDLLSEDGKVFRFGLRNLPGAEIRFIVPRDGHALSVHFEYRVTEYTVLERQSIVLRGGLPVSTVYTGSGFSTDRNFDGEYWLGREGVTWKDSAARWVIYRPDSVSSLQLNNEENRLWVNVDYAADHPLLYWPMESISNNYRIDRSATVLRPGERVSCYFRITRDETNLPLPAFTEAPFGKEGVFIFTEHADYTQLRSNRAVFFGSDTIASAKDATGGFAAYDLPVTKSVFYTNPDKVEVTDRAGFVSGEIATVKGTNGYKEFLQDLMAHGHEIALHTPDHFTTNRVLLNEALMVMQRDFKTSTWIDHGYDNGRKSNREDLVCDGFVPGSPMYAAGLFKEYRIRNVWNCFYEDSALYNDVTFNAELVTPHPAFGFAYPRPAWWRHSSVTGSIRHFRTTCTLAPRDPSMWSYYLNSERLDFLAEHRGVYVAHFYPARIDSVPAFYDWDRPVWNIQPAFDEALKTLSSYRDSGLIWVPTVSEYLDYVSARDAVMYSVTPQGNAVLHNTTNEPIKGLSMSVKATAVFITGKEVGKRRSGSDLVFWFDLAPLETVTIRLSQ